MQYQRIPFRLSSQTRGLEGGACFGLKCVWLTVTEWDGIEQSV